MFPRRKAAILAVCAPLVLTGCAGGLDRFFEFFEPAKIHWGDTSWCVPLSLKIAITKVAKRYGSVRVHSTHRWPLENARKGGKKKSYHLTCRAVDFSVRGGSPSEIKRYLVSMPQVGGYSYYPRGNFFHIDTGPRRTW
ncbi:MAG: YcbK family protein [Rhizobiaceae bacterium]|jgi:uncharacterized protein YcbK (DUF882 family)|nr:YcbK family protein [Rhizobiaceae bacterium]